MTMQMADGSNSQLLPTRTRFRPRPTCAAPVVRIAKMFHDLNVPWTEATRELQRTVAFLDECESQPRG